MNTNFNIKSWLLSSPDLYKSNFVKLRSQLPEEVSFQRDVFKSPLFILPDYGFSQKPKHVGRNKLTNLDVVKCFYFLSYVHVSQRDATN
jgi:hypothetical protein